MARRRNRMRRKNGAGLGAFLGSLAGAIVGGLGGVPLAVAGSGLGGAVGGWYGGQPDRERRGAVGGGVGGLFGPLFAAIGGYFGGRHPDKRKANPSPSMIALWSLLGLGIVGVPTWFYLRKKRLAKALVPPSQPPLPGQGPTGMRTPYYIFNETYFTKDAGVVQGTIEEQTYGGETVYVATLTHTPVGGVTQPPLSQTFSTSGSGSYLAAWMDASRWLGDQMVSYGAVTS